MKACEAGRPICAGNRRHAWLAPLESGTHDRELCQKHPLRAPMQLPLARPSALLLRFCRTFRSWLTSASRRPSATRWRACKDVGLAATSPFSFHASALQIAAGYAPLGRDVQTGLARLTSRAGTGWHEVAPRLHVVLATLWAELRPSGCSSRRFAEQVSSHYAAAPRNIGSSPIPLRMVCVTACVAASTTL